MSNSAKIHCGRLLAGGFFRELLVFAVVFQRAGISLAAS